MSGAANDTSWEVRNEVNALLHKALGVEPCDTACMHVVSHGWTAVGVANVIWRAAQREIERGRESEKADG